VLWKWRVINYDGYVLLRNVGELLHFQMSLKRIEKKMAFVMPFLMRINVVETIKIFFRQDDEDVVFLEGRIGSRYF